LAATSLDPDLLGRYCDEPPSGRTFGPSVTFCPKISTHTSDLSDAEVLARIRALQTELGAALVIADASADKLGDPPPDKLN
jgi:hypothetical protein